MNDDKHLRFTPGAHPAPRVTQDRTALALGRAVYGERVKRAMTQQVLADRLGVEVEHVQGVEMGETVPTFLTLRWLAQGLGAEGWSCREGENTVEFWFHGTARAAAA